MKNGHSRGEIITLTAPSGGVVSGTPAIIGDLITIPATTAAEGEKFEGAIVHAWRLQKLPSDSTTVGDAAYWNATANQVTTTATGNVLIGAFIDDTINGDTEVGVVLNGVTLGEYSANPPQLRAIDTVVIFGASIMEMSFEYPDSRNDFEDTMASLGMNISVYERATGTNNSASMEAVLPGIIEEFRDKAATTMFDTHWGGNDLANYPADAVEIETSLRRMAQAIKDAGFMIAMSNTTYRITPPYGWSSDEFNANVQDGIVNDFADIKLDMRKLTFENQAEWFGDPESGSFDGVHPSTAGRKLTRDYIANATAPYIKNVEFADGVALEDVLIQFGSRDVMTGGLNNALNNNNVPLYNTDYSEVVGGIVRVSQSTGVNNEGRGNVSDPANDSLTILNNEGLEDSFYSDSSFPILVDLSKANINAGDRYRIQATGSRVSTEVRNTTFAVGDIEGTINTSAAIPESTEFEVMGIDLLKNILECRRAAGTAYAYVSMIRVTRLPN